MKLYTEEQVIQAFKLGMNACMKHQDWALAINYPNKIELLEFMQSLTPIELPSDEEIHEYVKSTGYYGHCTQEYYEGIEEGAKYVINKIQGGNK